MTSWHVRYTTKVCQVCIIFMRHPHTKMSSSATLKRDMLCYPTAWRDVQLRNTMNTGKLKNMKFKASHFGVKNVPIKLPRTVFQLYWDQLFWDKLPGAHLKWCRFSCKLNRYQSLSGTQNTGFIFPNNLPFYMVSFSLICNDVSDVEE